MRCNDSHGKTLRVRLRKTLVSDKKRKGPRKEKILIIRSKTEITSAKKTHKKHKTTTKCKEKYYYYVIIITTFHNQRCVICVSVLGNPRKKLGLCTGPTNKLEIRLINKNAPTIRALLNSKKEGKNSTINY